MARQKFFTRTIKTKVVDATIISPETHVIERDTYEIPDGEDAREYIEFITEKVVISIEGEREVENLYKMTLDKFIENAVKVENDVKGN
nr:MAG TPA: hypothetical protein [Caudoviricetes sp.]